jgi:hypothetical protein
MPYTLQLSHAKEGMMGIKKIEKRLGFAALASAVQMLVASEVLFAPVE